MVRLPMPDDDTQLVIRRTYDAPIERVYAAWTDPEQLERWLRPNEEIAVLKVEADARVGGVFRMSYQVPGEAHANVVAGVYREVVPNERLSFSWAWEVHPDFPAEETLVTIDFTAQGDRTSLELTHLKFANRQMREIHAWGWTGAVELLAEHCRVVCRSIPDGQRPL